MSISARIRSARSRRRPATERGAAAHLGHVGVAVEVVAVVELNAELLGQQAGQEISFVVAGQGDEGAHVADALRADGYDGVVSFESVYHPGDGDFEAGFRLCIDRFRAHFG